MYFVSTPDSNPIWINIICLVEYCNPSYRAVYHSVRFHIIFGHNSCKCKHAYAIHSIDCTNYILLLSRGDIAVEYDKIGQMRPNWPSTNGGKRHFCYHFTVWDEFIVVAAVFFLSADKIPSIFTNWSDYWLGAIHIISSMHAECA